MFDFKTMETVNSVIVRPHFQEGYNFASLTIESNATNTWASPAFSTTLSITGDNDFSLSEFAAQNYRFWRVSGTGSTYFELADIFIGASFTPGKDLSNSFNYEFRDLSERQFNRYGQAFIDKISDKLFINFSIKLLGQTELDDIETFNNYCGKNKPFYMIVDPDECIMTDYRKLSNKFYMNRRPQVSHIIKGLSNVNYSVEECV